MTTDPSAQTNYSPTPANLAAREWFQDARFGMFIHWGIYSILGSGEWVQHERKIHVGDYEKLAAFFNPIGYDPAEWVHIARAAGMKYITITSRHHDGFAMFDTRGNDWNIVQRTPYGRDVLKPLADECRRQGIKLFFYYSHLDWHHADYFPRGVTGNDTGRPEAGDWNRYVAYMHTQLRELLTNYGEVAGIWFDGHWDRPDADWQLDATYKLIHDLQPHALVGNNHHLAPLPGEDFQMWERDLPGSNDSGFNNGTTVGAVPLETCDTLNGAWGFNLTDRNYKSTKQLVHYLVKAAGNSANLLLNVGPMPDGRIQPEFIERLDEVGRWTSKYGESIYGTRGGPVPPQPWGVTTNKGGAVYVHVIDSNAAEREDGAVCVNLAMPRDTIESARLFGGGTSVECVAASGGCALRIPDGLIDDVDTIVELTRTVSR